MLTNRVRGYFEDQDRRQREVEQPNPSETGINGLLTFCPNGHASLLLPGPDGGLITESLNVNSEAWRGVREVLEECFQYRHGPPQDVLNELARRMRRLKRELMPQIFAALIRNKTFNPFGINPDE